MFWLPFGQNFAMVEQKPISRPCSWWCGVLAWEYIIVL